jgi:hypothetical protein
MSAITMQYADETLTLTTDHAASSYGIPVLVIDGNAYGRLDHMPEGKGELGWIAPMETAEMAVTVAARNAGLLDHPMVQAFLGR